MSVIIFSAHDHRSCNKHSHPDGYGNTLVLDTKEYPQLFTESQDDLKVVGSYILAMLRAGPWNTCDEWCARSGCTGPRFSISHKNIEEITGEISDSRKLNLGNLVEK